ncbi:MAG: hypothetical protein EAZ81_09695 [Verrucomicrobia bacterium]|jgi:hypothetical protein|nr:MAG: hypothetical protein EAZ81_09695 [Verrucomicrobiota bacterium]
MPLPTKEDISPTSGADLDECAALEHFFGKNQSEASTLFFENPEYFADDLMWMGRKAFAFYFPSLEPYIISKESAGDADIINALIGILKARLDDDPVSIKDCHTPVLRVLMFARENLEKFQVDTCVNGDVAGELSDLIERVQTLGFADT